MIKDEKIKKDIGVSVDAPYLDIAYKRVKYDGRPVLKLSSGKKTRVEDKQVLRVRRNNAWAGDTIVLGRESLDGEPLLEPAMSEGIRIQPRKSLNEIRERCAAEPDRLPEAHKALKDPQAYPVDLSDELRQLQSKTVQEVVEKELGES